MSDAAWLAHATYWKPLLEVALACSIHTWITSLLPFSQSLHAVTFAVLVLLANDDYGELLSNPVGTQGPLYLTRGGQDHDREDDPSLGPRPPEFGVGQDHNLQVMAGMML